VVRSAEVAKATARIFEKKTWQPIGGFSERQLHPLKSLRGFQGGCARIKFFGIVGILRVGFKNGGCYRSPESLIKKYLWLGKN